MSLGLRLSLLLSAWRPSVACDLLSMWWAFRKTGSLSLNDAYLRWRLHTYHRDENHSPTREEILAFAKWRRQMARLAKN